MDICSCLWLPGTGGGVVIRNFCLFAISTMRFLSAHTGDRGEGKITGTMLRVAAEQLLLRKKRRVWEENKTTQWLVMPLSPTLLLSLGIFLLGLYVQRLVSIADIQMPTACKRFLVSHPATA